MYATTSTTTALQDGTWVVRPADTVATFTVRELGLIPIRGTLPVTSGTVTVAGGRLVAASATLDAAAVRTGNAKRDRDLAGRKFFHTERHPDIEVQSTRIAPDGDGWTAEAVLTVAGGGAPLVLRGVRLPDGPAGTVRVRLTGVLDRAATPIAAPRALIGRWVGIQVDATLALAS